MIQNWLKCGNRSVYILPSGEKVSVADKIISSCHMILWQTAKHLYPEDVISLIERDNFVVFQVIICLVWKQQSIAILTQNLYWFVPTIGGISPHIRTHIRARTHTHTSHVCQIHYVTLQSTVISKVICSLQIFRLSFLFNTSSTRSKCSAHYSVLDSVNPIRSGEAHQLCWPSCNSLHYCGAQ